MITSFEDLEVYQRAYAVSLEIHRVSMEFPSREQYGMADQVRRASKSICANLAEGFAKQYHSKAEFRRYIVMAVGSSDEMRVWLHYLLDLSLISEDKWSVWNREYHQISKMLQGLYRSWE